MSHRFMAYLATLILIIAALTYHSLELGKIAAYEQRVTQISEQEIRDSVERFVEKNKDDRVKLIKFAKKVDRATLSQHLGYFRQLGEFSESLIYELGN